MAGHKVVIVAHLPGEPFVESMDVTEQEGSMGFKDMEGFQSPLGSLRDHLHTRHHFGGPIKPFNSASCMGKSDLIRDPLYWIE